MKKNKMTKKEEMQESLKRELEEAVEQFKIAQESFNNAEPDYIVIANDFLTAAKINLDATYRRIKLLEKEIESYEY